MSNDRYEKIRKALAECRDIAMEWTMRGRIPECGKFGEIAQDLDALCAELEITDSERTQQPANDEVVFIDGVGAGRRDIKSCRDGVQWIEVGDRVYWPLSESDAKRLQSACCGNGSFDGPTTPTSEDAVRKTLGAQNGVVAWARLVYARPVNAPEPAGEWDELVDIEFHNRPEKPEGEGWRPLVLADTGDGAAPLMEEREQRDEALAKINEVLK